MHDAQQKYYVFIVTDLKRTEFHVGFTDDLVQWMTERRSGQGKYFAGRYDVARLVYYEISDSLFQAEQRESAIKAGSNLYRLDLVASINPDWRDLFYDIIQR